MATQQQGKSDLCDPDRHCNGHIGEFQQYELTSHPTLHGIHPADFHPCRMSLATLYHQNIILDTEWDGLEVKQGEAVPMKPRKADEHELLQVTSP